MLAYSEPRCIGKGAGASGHQLFVECVNCQRRTAPRPAGEVWFMEPSSEFPCPNHVPAEPGRTDRVGAEGWRRMAEAQQGLVELDQRIKELSDRYGI